MADEDRPLETMFLDELLNVISHCCISMDCIMRRVAMIPKILLGSTSNWKTIESYKTYDCIDRCFQVPRQRSVLLECIRKLTSEEAILTDAPVVLFGAK